MLSLPSWNLDVKIVPLYRPFASPTLSYLYQPRTKLAWSSMAIQSQPCWADHGFERFFLGKPYINRGISGELTSEILCRFRPDVIAIRPRVVVILAGTNDIKFANVNDVAGITRPTTFQAITANFVSMAELARANDILVVLSSLLPVSDYERDKDGKQIIRTAHRPPDQIKTLNKWIKEYAARNGHTYLDYHSAMIDEKGFLRDELSDNGLHPNDNGYGVMAPLAEQALATAQRSKG